MLDYILIPDQNNDYQGVRWVTAEIEEILER